jgi:hypothetical protein
VKKGMTRIREQQVIPGGILQGVYDSHFSFHEFGLLNKT